MLFTVEYVL